LFLNVRLLISNPLRNSRFAMDSLRLTDFASYKEYFRLICEGNKQLGPGQYLFGDVEIAQSDAAQWQGKKLWAWPSQRGRMQGMDNYILDREGTIWVGGAPASEKSDDVDAYYVECEKLMKQIISKMIRDLEEAEIAVVFTTFTVQRADMELSGTDFIGCEMIFTFQDPDDFEYLPDEWNFPEVNPNIN
jgi:hypothetical protein